MTSSPAPQSAGRPIALGAVILVGVGLLVASQFAAVPDRCLAGRWRVVESTSFPKVGSLELRDNGTAAMTEFQEAPYEAIWKTNRDLLEVTLVSRHRPDLDEEAEDLGRTWRLRWKILESTPEVLRLEGPVDGNRAPGHISLSRQ